MSRRVFMSYSHEDRAWRDAFRQMLGPALERYGVELWADDHIRSGERWERAIDGALDGAELGLLLVTPTFLMPGFSWEVEVPALLAKGVPVVWVLVKDCLWEDVEALAEFQGLQDQKRALADHPEQTRELARICRKIRDEHLAGLRAAGPGPRPAISQPPVEKLADLIAPTAPGRVFGAVPRRPPAFVSRGSDLDGLRAEVTSGLAGAVGVTGTPSVFGLHGRGGIGKTVLAAELTRDPQALVYFPDGVFWVSLGERVDVVDTQRELIGWLGGDADAVRSPLQGTKVLRELRRQAVPAGRRRRLVAGCGAGVGGYGAEGSVAGDHAGLPAPAAVGRDGRGAGRAQRRCGAGAVGNAERGGAWRVAGRG